MFADREKLTLAIQQWEASHHTLSGDDRAAIVDCIEQNAIDWFELTGRYITDYTKLAAYYAKD